MSGPLASHAQAEVRDESVVLLRERVRLGMWLMLLGAGVFALTDLRFESDQVVRLYLLKLANVPFVLAGFWLLRRSPSRLVAMSVALMQIATICFLTALAGYVAQEEITGPIMIVFIVFTAALILPWSTAFQIAATLIAIASLLLLQILLHGNVAIAFTRDGVAVAAALVASVLVAWNLERQRRAQQDGDTERRQASAALAAAEERKSAILSTALDAIITCDCDGNVLEMNPAAEKLFGYRGIDVVGREFSSLVVPERDREEHRRSVARLIATGESPWLGRRFEVMTMRADGTEFPAEVSTTMAGTGRNRTYTNYIRDLTDQRRAQRETRRLVEILEATNDLVGTTDETGQVLYYNEAGRRLLGIAEGEDLSKLRSADNMPSRWWQTVVEGSTIAATEGRAWRGEVELSTRDGRIIPVSQVIVAHRDDDGHIRAFSTIARDISEQKRAEKALQEDADVSRVMARLGQELIAALGMPRLNQRLCDLTASVLQSDVTHTFLWDEQRGAYVLFAGLDLVPDDTAALSALAIPPEALRGLLERLERDEVACLRISPAPPDAPRGEEEISLAEARVSDKLIELVRRRGFHYSVYMALRRGGKLIGFQSAGYLRESPPTRVQMRLARGLSQMASLIIEQAQLVDALERANRLKSEFVATMSHELRTPLNVIMGYNSLLAEGDYGPISKEQREVMSRIDRSSQELLELINATLDMSRLDAGRLPLDVGEVNGVTLLREMEAEARRIRLKSGVALVWDAASDLPQMRTDASKIKVVLRNLLGNAAKFTDRGTIRVAARRDGDVVEITVSDTGIGIPAEAQPIIFEAFRQVDGSSTRRHGGVGLGLYIVKRLVDMLGGTVELASEEGKGSKFTVRLPCDVESRITPSRRVAPPLLLEPALKRTA